MLEQENPKFAMSQYRRGDSHGHEYMVVGFTTTYAISANHH